MPFVHIRIAGSRLAPLQVETLRRDATRLMAEILGKKAELTAVLIEEPEIARWSVGGEAVRVAAHLEAKVTAGTNSAEEKARFVERGHALLREAVDPGLPLATYVVVDELPADAWGYGGRTQEARRAEDRREVSQGA